MLDLYQLRHFVAVADCGTVLHAADSLNMTQPALSRSLQNLETELGAQLFDRGKNKITLNDTGIFAAERFRTLLAQAEQAKADVQSYHQQHHSIVVGSCAPCKPALDMLQTAIQAAFPNSACRTEIMNEEALAAALRENKCTVGIFVHNTSFADFDLLPFYDEQLYAMIPDSHPLSKQSKGIHFADINGEPVIPFPLKGHWNTVLEAKLPDSQKIYQTSVESFATLIQSAAMICFASTARLVALAGHTAIPVLDDEAHITYHVACLKNNASHLRQMFQALSNSVGGISDSHLLFQPVHEERA